MYSMLQSKCYFLLKMDIAVSTLYLQMPGPPGEQTEEPGLHIILASYRNWVAVEGEERLVQQLCCREVVAADQSILGAINRAKNFLELEIVFNCECSSSTSYQINLSVCVSQS